MGITYNASIVRDGLVLHLDAANPKSYPGSGVVWKDLSGLANNTTLINGAVFNNGNFVFDGTNDRVDTGSTFSDIISGTKDFTIDCIAYPLAIQNTYADIWGNHNEPYKGIVLQQNSNYLNQYSWAVGTGNAWRDASTFFTLQSLKYSYISCIRQNGYFLTYVNSSLISSVSDNSSLVANLDYNFQLGVGWHLNSSRYWKGSIPMFKTYNRALSATEVKQNFEALRKRYGI